MTNFAPSNLTIKTAKSIMEINEQDWDKLSAGKPFQSRRWYQFGERVMNDCEPIYLLAYRGDALIGCAALWKIHNEPILTSSRVGSALLQLILRRWPLLICRSPLSSTAGLILPPDEPLRSETLKALSETALNVSRQNQGLALIFDFLSKRESHNWQSGFSQMQIPGPGTIMRNRWRSLEEYLSDGNKKDRQHYKRTLREAEKLGIKIEKYNKVPDVNVALELIENVDRRYKNAPNPWMRSLLENLEMANGVWLEARQNEKLVGCGALFEDNHTQLTVALGLAENIPYVYLLLAYASLEEAFRKNVHALRWGSGAYDVKQNLGFVLEENNYIILAGMNALLNWMTRFT
jgi:predicted N-acyltransferase